MSPALHQECTRIPVTALASSGPFFFAAEAHSILFYRSENCTLLRKERIFEAQAIHGIVVHSESQDGHVILAIWGGYLVRLFEIVWRGDEDITFEILQLSAAVKSPDWILDLAASPAEPRDNLDTDTQVCAAVTAHNALLEFKITRDHEDKLELPSTESKPLTIHLAELTSSSRSILYSAHILWESSNHILVAAGTAFGEIILWSWTRSTTSVSHSHIHQVFLGHEGSIFGVRISKILSNFPVQGVRRLLASCSDDRTIRIWDISNISYREDGAPLPAENPKIRHTGFSSTEFDPDLSTSTCIATGWGHLSRVWSLQFLETADTEPEVFLLSSGEDATSRTWKLSLKENLSWSDEERPSFDLLQVNNAAFHNGKNIWSAIVLSPSSRPSVICGAADSQITLYPLSLSSETPSIPGEYTVDHVSRMARASGSDATASAPTPTHKSSKMAEFFRSYAFIDTDTILLTTNSGKVYIETLASDICSADYGVIKTSSLVAQSDDLFGYSICVAEPFLGVGFIAGSKGSIFVYDMSRNTIERVFTTEGKVGNMFVARASRTIENKSIVLALTLVGHKSARILFLDCGDAPTFTISRTINVNLSEALTGLTVTCMTYIPNAKGNDHLFLGFRRGSIALYSIPKASSGIDSVDGSAEDSVTAFSIIDKAHGKETVTSLKWTSSSHPDSTVGHLVSVGRDGHLAIHSMSLRSGSIELVHDISLCIGSNLEGLHYVGSRLLVYGFSSTKFVLYDSSVEKEIMSVETGGSHRSWAFHPSLKEEGEGGGTLVWTRASSMHVQSHRGSTHRVIRSGGHGREIKAVAVTKNIGGEPRQLIATGAEDTDIKIFEYVSGDLTCLQTLRKHTTGIQHLKWSDNGDYLFSSGGCEEFYIWHIRLLPDPLGLGVVCEAVSKPESDHSDLRILSFDVRNNKAGFIIALVFSDSTVKIFSYDPSSAIKWHKLASGTYFTSCLTQAAFLPAGPEPDTLLTAGTDGHAVLWSLPTSLYRTSNDAHSSCETLVWTTPARIHQSTSKTMDSLEIIDAGVVKTLIASGGDDSSITFLLSTSQEIEGTRRTSWTHPPLIITRTHASAVTACSFLRSQDRIHLVTSGNDQWVRVWNVLLQGGGEEHGEGGQDPLEISRSRKIKTNVADVSSMAVVAQSEGEAKVLICGVGMEVIRIQWD